MSEPVTQATLRIVKVFWGLSASLAYKRHFPAIDWIQSYSLYLDKLEDWYRNNIHSEWSEKRGEAMSLLQEESSLNEIVRLVGIDALSDKDRITMETAKSLREDYLHQDAFNDIDTYASLHKQYVMLKLILSCHHESLLALENNADLDDVISISSKEAIGRFKYTPENEVDEKAAIVEKKMKQELAETYRVD